MQFENEENPTVYSSELGRVCPDCRQPIKNCICVKKTKQNNKSNFDGTVRLRIDRKKRAGKSVTIIDGITGNENDLKTMAKDIKKQCGTGGAVKDGMIEIQGDVRDFLISYLQQKGFNVKKAGG
jgi:translation initiation factor 1